MDNWVSIESGSVPALSISRGLSHMLCLHSDNMFIILLHRAAFLTMIGYILSLINCFTHISDEFFFRYTLPSIDPVFASTSELVCGSSSGAIYISMMIWPCMFSIFTMILLFPIMLCSKDISQTLHWVNKCKIMGCHIRCKNKDILSPIRAGCSIDYSDLLYRNLVHNILHLKEKQFWHTVWNDIVCKLAPSCRKSNRSESSISHCNSLYLCLQYVSVCCILPLSFPLILIHVLPAFSILTNLVRNPKKLFLPKPFHKHSLLSILVIITFTPLVLYGIVYMYLLVLNFTIFLAYSTVFLGINIIHQGYSILSKIILVVSLMIYVRSTVVSFNEAYHDLKVASINTAEKIWETTAGQGSILVLCKDKETPLLKSFGEFGLNKAIPRALFSSICLKVRPYAIHLIKAILHLVVTILSICFLLFVVIYFQLFTDLSEVGETMVTIFTVCLPKLLGTLGSSAKKDIKHTRQLRLIEQTIFENTIIRTSL